ncbi:S-(hydroxymethyl)glutathione synthase [Hydrocarboniphaga sp.]|uniref:S-(hydroxymethyl)glutathione synthase n=1 Tax=Hydrocarboniphaga sp. TaxID=2033016 RepID=UPI0026393481|nr:S-(hydroxymethyl)glutathione synthase [Hydrocarboniphaga sp.]
MERVETEIEINASPQTVWSVMDDLERYPEWNPLVPEFSGRTTVGRVLSGTIVLHNVPAFPLTPTLLRVVGARELRWITVAEEQGISGEHYFILTPTAAGGTHFVHNEEFEGPAVTVMWPGIEAVTRPVYINMNQALKARAEAMEAIRPMLHPAVDGGVTTGSGSAGATLRCHCAEHPVEVRIDVKLVHNHLCGCSKCWKPGGALFAQTAVVPAGTLHVIANEDKLSLVDASQSIKRHACRDCGVHMFGRVDDVDHHFYGLEFVHPELAIEADMPAPEFAGFTSSLVEAGKSPSHMTAIRKRLAALGIPSYDAFSPELMDIIAWHKVKILKHSKSAAD